MKLLAGEIALSPQHRTVLERKGLLPGWRLACLSRVEEDLTIEVAQFDNIVLADETPFRFTPREGRGIAVDLGSTTIVSQLLDLSTGRVQAVQTDINPQARHGADIMSRISYAIQSEEHAARLTALVRETVGRHVLTLTAQAPGPIDRIRIVGNSVMHHLFCGLDVGPLAAYPFESPDNGMRHFSAAELGWLEVPEPSLRSALLKRNTPIEMLFPPQNRTTRITFLSPTSWPAPTSPSCPISAVSSAATSWREFTLQACFPAEAPGY